MQLIANQVFDWIHIALYKQSFDDKRNHGGIQPQLRMRIWPMNNTSASATKTSLYASENKQNTVIITGWWFQHVSTPAKNIT